MKTIITTLLIVLPLFVYSQGPPVDFDVLTKDIIHCDDVIINCGSLCVGFDCVNGESFGFDTQKLKENNLRIYFDDTSTTSNFPDNDWRIVINDTSNGGDEYFAVEDASAGKHVFKVFAGARSNALIVDSQGDLGLGTASPATDIDIKTGNTPTIRIQQDGTSGFTPQSWDLAGNETNFFVRDVTNGSKLPFRIRPDSPTGSIVCESSRVNINQDGQDLDFQVEGDTDPNVLYVDASTERVGIGTNAPDHKLHVDGDIGKTGNLVGVSDELIKTDIYSIDNAMEIIRQLDGKEFRYKVQDFPKLNLSNELQYGLIAQQVESVLEEIVHKKFMTTTDINGEDHILKGIEYEQLIPFLINAIKEQETVINQQKALIAQIHANSENTNKRLAKLEQYLNIEETDLKKTKEQPK